MAAQGKTSEINILIQLNEDKIPEKITWQASDSTAEGPQETKAFLLSMWDPHYKETLRIDLWTKEMQQEEMNVFFFQTFMTMADTYLRANNDPSIVEEIKEFAYRFGEKVQVIKRK
ncbi:MAG: gliding motility protein GldC [Fimbriimonadaceae bacterium]|nr:gliding motility protein GldC [Chitinophagales bacterium]